MGLDCLFPRQAVTSEGLQPPRQRYCTLLSLCSFSGTFFFIYCLCMKRKRSNGAQRKISAVHLYDKTSSKSSSAYFISLSLCVPPCRGVGFSRGLCPSSLLASRPVPPSVYFPREKVNHQPTCLPQTYQAILPRLLSQNFINSN